MATKPIEAKKPWDDRWNKPVVEQLLEPIEQNRRNLFTRVMENLKELDGVEKQLVWLGISWRWTIVYTLDQAHGGGQGQSAPDPNSADPADWSNVAFAYLVPNPRQPTVCIPMTNDQVNALPQRGINRYIKDGVKSAKQAVNIHWCKWIATSHAEVEHLTDLAQRKHQFETTPR